MNNLLINFDNKSVRLAIDQNKETLFCAKDVCTILGLENNSRAIKTIPDKYLTTLRIDTIKRSPNIDFLERRRIVPVNIQINKTRS